MKQNYITLDFLNQNYSARIDNIEHAFSSETEFYDLTKFPYKDNLSAISVEPDRNIFTVVYRDNTQKHDEHSEEIQWIMSHLDNFKEALLTDMVAIMPSEPTLSQYRDGLLINTDWVFARHNEEKALGISATLSDAKLKEVLEYRQQLRDITKTYTSLQDVVWPTNPLD